MIKTSYIFIALIILNYLIYWLTNYFILSDEVYLSYFSNRYSGKVSNEIVERITNIRAYVDLLHPILLTFKIILIFIILQFGLILTSLKIKNSILFRIVIISEFIFSIAPILTLFWFTVIQIEFEYNDLINFPPNSLLVFNKVNELEYGVIYFLQSINLSELLYVITLSYLLGVGTNSGFKIGFKIVSLSYIPAFFLWLILVTLLFLSLS
ncbi:hypothetical protein [Aquirufa aurantiipilula]|uniref:Yip1 domain-containing protein n=1 Tax=Aquirufa aurantiipilula TaxID=2696561 RepID=A0ABT6BN39_9BACT|nr:hypothetical protein [Aquirufa aurantiipilula]MDF5691586.1 hypothetical protein [Aquirufa aurantiipilula]